MSELEIYNQLWKELEWLQKKSFSLEEWTELDSSIAKLAKSLASKFDELRLR